ncbi:hypothetical protein [Paraburkholderia strydomiana]|uniref:hypothetical protein n=1 Tax=Paraburkholderia strydomiana TaxID=1245417 RepID=UPI001BE7CE4D|nr:hypothetical protein [Paraburkholderia strydomiana]MBT2792878.1 hypothetical protein [Paraburkholderia strydomiana]
MASFDEPSILSEYNGGEKLIAGILLAVVTFWLFAPTTLNVLPSMRADLQIDDALGDIAVSIAALFSGILMVGAGGLANTVGRVKTTAVGFAMSIAGSLLIAASPQGTAPHQRASFKESPRRASCRRRSRYPSVLQRRRATTSAQLLGARNVGRRRSVRTARRAGLLDATLG